MTAPHEDYQSRVDGSACLAEPRATAPADRGVVNVWQHTPGPWTVNRTDGWWVEHGDFHTIASLTPWPEVEGNARLIAAAPEMLKACRAIVLFHESVFITGRPLSIDGRPVDHWFLNDAARIAQDAIAKAEGHR